MGIEHMIDHTMLKADASKDTIIRYCSEAREHKFASVCVNTCFVPLVAEQLKGSGVKTCCVVGFPLTKSPDISSTSPFTNIRPSTFGASM